MRLYRQGDYTVRKLVPAEWTVLRAVRMEAVAQEPNIFVFTTEDEKNRPEEEWRAILRDTNRAYFILVHGEEDIVGVTGIAKHSHDPSIGVLVASYIRTAHRGKGLSNMFYQARIDWALRKNLKKLIVSHRKDNKPSKYAMKRFYFDYMYDAMTKWPDGTKEKQYFYQLDLQKWREVFD